MEIDERRYVEKTLKNYQDKKLTKLDELKALDRKVKTGPLKFAVVYGSIGSLILGFGMSIAMGVILPKWIGLGILIGLIGLIMISSNYYIYRKLLNNEKSKYATQIRIISNELLNNDLE